MTLLCLAVFDESGIRARQHETMEERARSISIIVPVINESGLIRGFLTELRRRAPAAEVIVVDGGSTDETPRLAADLCHHVISAPRGRGAQMNAGARVACGAILWFLHADADIPAGSLEEIARVLQDERTVGGFFRIRLPKNNLVYRLTDNFAHYAGMLLRMRCGDHGFFCRRDMFAKLNGFPEVPLMEDVEFFRALHRSGRIAVVHQRLVISPRRYEEMGPVRLTLAYGLIASLYVLGVPLRFLSSLYNRLCFRAAVRRTGRIKSRPLHA